MGPNNSFVNTLYAAGNSGALKLLAQNVHFKDLNFPSQMQKRGFKEDESDGLQDFHYRTDGYRFWKIFRRYVKSSVNKIYPTESDFLKDTVIQKFSESLNNPREGNIPGWTKRINSREDLVKRLTMIIFGTTVQHQVRIKQTRLSTFENLFNSYFLVN